MPFPKQENNQHMLLDTLPSIIDTNKRIIERIGSFNKIPLHLKNANDANNDRKMWHTKNDFTQLLDSNSFLVHGSI